MVESPRQTASKPAPPTVAGENREVIKTASGAPTITPTVPVKNIIKALGPNLNMAFRSMLKVIKTKAAGSKYLLAIK